MLARANRNRDNIFATYMTSLSSKEIAYSNFIQVIRSKTAMGFVPNYSAGGTKSIDRTEPPIGAKVLLEMFKKFKDVWIVELLFDDLLAWNDWFVAERMLGAALPSGLVYTCTLKPDLIRVQAPWGWSRSVRTISTATRMPPLV
jgi:hypothetical protein